MHHAATTVWEFTDKQEFNGYNMKAVDKIAPLLGDRESRLWKFGHTMTVVVRSDKTGSVIMCFDSQKGRNINYLATRILVDQKLVHILHDTVSYQERDNIAAYCIRGSVFFYWRDHDRDSDTHVCSMERPQDRVMALKLLPYPWYRFCQDWRHFYRDSIPYSQSGATDMRSLYSKWTAVVLSNDTALIYDELATNSTKTMTTKEFVCAKHKVSSMLLAQILMKLSPQEWIDTDQTVVMQRRLKIRNHHHHKQHSTPV